jgi:hypothetical protein
MKNDSLYDNWKDFLIDMQLGYLESHTKNVEEEEDEKLMDKYRDVGMSPSDFYSGGE